MDYIFLRELNTWAEVTAGKYKAVADIIRSGDFSKLSPSTWAKVADALEKLSEPKKRPGRPSLKNPDESKHAARNRAISKAFDEGRNAGIPYKDVISAIAEAFKLSPEAIEKAKQRGDKLLNKS